jgi:hypothetical protein
VRKKVISPEHRRAAKAMVADGLCSGRGRVPVLEDVTGDILVSAERANEPGAAAAQATQGAEREARSLRQSAHRRVIAAGRLGGGQKARPALAAFHWSAGAAEQAQGAPGAMSGAGTSSRMAPREEEPAHADDPGRIHSRMPCAAPTGRLKAETCLNGWNGPSRNTELRPT